MSSLYLRFAAPYQSWAGPRVAGNNVNTALLPTRSGITGLAAAALGARRGEWPDWLQELGVEIRVDNPGRIEKDFQTINPRPEVQDFVDRIWKASGLRRSAPVSFTPDGGMGTAIVRRTYLAGAEFVVRLSHDTHVDELASAFAVPGFSPYMGRKAFAPTFPFLLGVGPNTLLSEAPGGKGAPLRIYVVDGRDTTYPDRTAVVNPSTLAEQMSWWSANASLPQRLPVR